MKKTILAILLLVSVSVAFGQTNSKQQKIKQLLVVTGSGNLSIQMMKSIMGSYQKSHPQIPQEFWNNFMQEVKADDLEKIIIPIYDKHFTETEIDDLVKFYNTPAGKKMIEKMPLIMQESMSAGRIWGKEIAERVAARLKEQGYIKNPSTN